MLKSKTPNEYYMLFNLLDMLVNLLLKNRRTSPGKKLLILNLQMNFWWKKMVKWLWKDVLNGYMIWWDSILTRKVEETPETNEVFYFGYKQNKTKKMNTYIILGCESDELYTNYNLFYLWCIKFMNEEIRRRDFKITSWLFLDPGQKKQHFYNSKRLLLNTFRPIKNMCLCTVYNTWLLRFSLRHHVWVSFSFLSGNSFNQSFRKKHWWISRFKTFSTLYSTSKLLKNSSLTYHVWV